MGVQCIEIFLAISIFDMLKNPLWNHKVVKIRRRCQIQKLRPHCGKQWSLVKSCCFHATGLTLKRAENDIFAWLRDTTNGNEECVCIATLLGSIYYLSTDFTYVFQGEKNIHTRPCIHKPKFQRYCDERCLWMLCTTCLNTDPSTLEKTKLIY